MMKTREQSLFDEIYRRCQALGYAVYDYKPIDEVPYPFVEFEDTETVHVPNKSDIKGFVSLKVSVWGSHRKRKQVSDMAAAIFAQALSIEETAGYFWTLNTRASTIQVLDDTTTTTPLKRAWIHLEFTMR